VALAGLAALLLPAAQAGSSAGASGQASDFAWRSTLSVPAGTAVAQVALPADALLHMQSRSGDDVRVFNAAGESLAYARMGQAAPPVAQQSTPDLPAFALQAARPGAAPPNGSVEVHLGMTAPAAAGGNATVSGSYWVRWQQAAAVAGTAPYAQAVLLDTRAQKRPLDALDLDAKLPANTLVHIAVFSSPDLKNWTSVPVRGPVFRFEGQDAPGNTRLEFVQPTRLEGRYLQLGWSQTSGVALASARGLLAPDSAAPQQVQAELPAGTLEGQESQSWALDIATPMLSLELQAARDNTLVPVRIQVRNDAAQPWRTIAQTVVYRLNLQGQIRSNPALPLPPTSARWLRVQATQAPQLPPGGFTARVGLEPVHIAFLATGTAPFELAVGQATATPAAVDLSLIQSAVATGLQDVPQATLGSVTHSGQGGRAGAAGSLSGLLSGSRLLWAVLVLGVLVLGGVAVSLLRQLGQKPQDAAP
jgi:hypothetical protein